MNAFTVSSEGSRVLKLGTGAGASLDLEDFCWATESETSKQTREQQSNERRMSSFRERDFLYFHFAVKAIVIRLF
jgi:hypothetical protein